MEVIIRQFKINLDISDRHTVYDYEREQFIYKSQEGSWDMNLLQGSNQSNSRWKADRTGMLDKILQKTRSSERNYNLVISTRPINYGGTTNHAFSSAFANAQQPTTSQSLPMRVLPVYSPGEMVRGTLLLELTAPIKAKELTLTFKGQAFCLIVTKDRYRIYNKTSTEVYVNQKKVFWKKGNGNGEPGRLSTDYISTSQFLPAGKHEIPFSFYIPQDARPSIPTLWDRGNTGPTLWGNLPREANINYRFKAVIEQKRCLGSGNISVFKGILVDRPVDIGLLRVPGFDLMSPTSKFESLNAGLFGTAGAVTVKATLPKKAFTRTEKIPVVLEVHNETDEPVDEVEVRVILAGMVRARTVCIPLQKKIIPEAKPAMLGPVPARQSRQLSTAVTADFSESSVYTDLLPGSGLNDCFLIDVNYMVEVKVRRKGFRRNIKMWIPIILGTENSSDNIW